MIQYDNSKKSKSSSHVGIFQRRLLRRIFILCISLVSVLCFMSCWNKMKPLLRLFIVNIYWAEHLRKNLSNTTKLFCHLYQQMAQSPPEYFTSYEDAKNWIVSGWPQKLRVLSTQYPYAARKIGRNSDFWIKLKILIFQNNCPKESISANYLYNEFLPHACKRSIKKL